jgi:endonuclease IV
MGKITFGTAGNIDSDILSSLKKLNEIGLDGQEIEFVRGVTMSNETAQKAGDL